MKKLLACLALAFFAPIFGSLYAQEDQQASEQYEPPPPVGVDVDYFAPPKQKLTIGARFLSGPKISFFGHGSIPSNVSPSSGNYNDGNIGPDTRNDAASNQSLQSSANADGRSNTWQFSSASQIDGNGVDLHAYSATDNGNNSQSDKGQLSSGVEVVYERDFGWHLGKLEIDIIGGLSLNKIGFSENENISGTLTTLTDHYSTFNTVLNGNGDPVLNASGNPTYTPGPPPTGPYSAPSSTNDAAGNSVDNSTLISDSPTDNIPTPPSSTEITQQVSVNGAYFTLRAGPQLTLPLTTNFSASLSGGPALVYAGSTLTVTQTVTPPTGDAITNTQSDTYYTVLPAYFADASLECTLTDTTGLYLGATFQGSTGYNQSIHSQEASFTDRVELGNEEGVRAGINFKF
jgi:hypothetical protein